MPLPHPVFPSVHDIKLYILSESLSGPVMIGPNLYGSSLAGQRTIADFFKLLDHVIHVPTNNFRLQKLDDTHRLVERLSPGNITAGNYLILPSVEGGEVSFRLLLTFFDFQPLGTETPVESAAKRANRDGRGSTASDRSARDPSNDSQGFKMRLVYRDKGCVVCLAAGVQAFEARYLYHEDSIRFEGAHIIDFTYRDVWDSRNFSTLVKDPFTDPAYADSQFASYSTRTKKDHRRINSLENGILLCLNHHRDYNNFRFAIHPETHKIFAFHPATARFQDVEVKAPWDNPDVKYPPPLPALLEMHYQTSIAKATKANGGGYELDDDDDDDEEEEELESEPEEVRNEAVRIWIDSSLSST